MCPLIHLLQSVPDVIWSGIVASALTLGGVLVSNNSNNKRLKVQLDHDADQKTKERTLNLRREVYLETAVELARIATHLATLPVQDPGKGSLATGTHGFFQAAAKLQLVAEPDTALLMGKLTGKYGELVVRALILVAPLHDVKITIDLLGNLYKQEQAQVDRLLSEMSRFNETQQSNAEIFNTLRRSCEFRREEAAKYASEQQEAWAKFRQLNEDYSRKLLADLRDISEQQVSVMDAIRSDLGLSSDPKAMKAQVDDQWTQMSKQFDDFLSSFKNR